MDSVISKNDRRKLFILLLPTWLMNVFATVLYFMGYREFFTYMITLVVCMTWLILFLFFTKKYGFFCLQTLCLVCLGFFNFGRLFLYLIGTFDYTNEVYGIIQQYKWETSTIFELMNYYLFFLNIFGFVTVFTKKKTSYELELPVLRSRTFPAEHILRKLFTFAFYVSLPLMAYFYLKQVSAVRVAGYETLYIAGEGAYSGGFLMRIVHLVFTISYFMICMVENNEKRFDIASILYILVTGIQLIQGSRAGFISAVLVFLYVRYRLYGKKIKGIYVVLGLVLGIIGIYFIGCLRDGTMDQFSIGGAFQYFFVSMSGSLSFSAYYIQNRAALAINSYPYVTEPLLRVVLLILHPEIGEGQSLALLAHRFSLPHQLTYFMSPAYYLQGAGLGGCFMAELAEYGIVEVILGSFLLSSMITYFDNHLVDNLFLRFMAVDFVTKIMLEPRSEMFYDTYNLLKFYIIYRVIILFGESIASIIAFQRRQSVGNRDGLIG